MQIDWLTVAAQIVNFLVLVWLLQRFLYRPITDAMARREERIETRLSEAKAARAEVEAEATRLREKQQELEASREEVLRAARQEASDLRTALEDDLRKEMEARRKTWETHLEEERDAFAARLRQRAGHQVIDIVGRVLRDYAGSDLAGQVAATFLQRLADLDAEAREKLSDAARRADGPARVESGVPLEPSARSRITRAVHEHIAPDIEVDYREDDALLLGVRLTIGEQTVEWSATRFLGRLETTLDEVIEGSSRRRSDRAPAKA
ncbi:F0F1 ATP synthase subunit delta [Rhodovulum euryhalinum]|uniref:ATP synthase subunit b n=1 Tax=Rhodovulum euryhalinum TaxID=35805 RepID=A0A4R2K8Y2_9RHOB|nr:F0F1 ATP synthase subunit delta [Rhodovulum euryhalinum]TCO69114.1 ATP synthase F0 subcomplex B subunit [Rhodovulum euryhalinum]